MMMIIIIIIIIITTTTTTSLKESVKVAPCSSESVFTTPSARDCDAAFIRKFAGYKFLIIGRPVLIIWDAEWTPETVWTL
jgi:hypothetical protein